VNPVKTKDSKEVALCIHSIDEIDETLLRGIKNDIVSTMTVEQALDENIQYHLITLNDSNNVVHCFYACFVLTYDKQKVIEANIISFLEI
jgi:hypothetical protein